MSYNLQSLHLLYLDKIKKKNQLQKLLINNKNDKNQTHQQKDELNDAKDKLQTQYKNVMDCVDQYTLDNLNLISILYDQPDKPITDEIYNNYVKKYFNYEVKLLSNSHVNPDSCINCNATNTLIENIKGDQFICIDCGSSTTAHRVVTSYEQTLEIKSTTKKNGYSKCKSLHEYLDYIQLRKPETVTKEEEKQIVDKLKHIDISRITINLIQSAMQLLKFNYLYNDKYFIYFVLTKKKITLSPGTEKQIHFHFFLVLQAFDVFKNDHDRMNIFLYKYSVKKIAEILLFKLKNPNYKPVKKPEIEMNFPNTDDLSEVVEKELTDMINIIPHPIIKSFDNLFKYDCFFKKICSYLGWKFISSF